MLLTILQIIVSIALILTILLQAQGSGLSTSFGGGGEFYRSKRSVERILIYVSVFLVICFGVISVVLLLPHK